MIRGSEVDPIGAPAAIHRRSTACSGRSGVNRIPPPWGNPPSALSNKRLRSGAAGKTLRPRASAVIAKWSALGSKPKTDNLKPFCPSAFPWHPDVLQP